MRQQSILDYKSLLANLKQLFDRCLQGDHVSEKPGNDRVFYSCQENVREKMLSEKTVDYELCVWGCTPYHRFLSHQRISIILSLFVMGYAICIDYE